MFGHQIRPLRSIGFTIAARQVITFLPKDHTARAVCIETLDERGKPWREEQRYRGKDLVTVIAWDEDETDNNPNAG